MYHIDLHQAKAIILRHRLLLTAAVTLLLVIGYFAAAKTAYIIIDNNQEVKRTYTPGIRVMLTEVIPDPIYAHSQPYTAQIMCADGEKFLVLGGISVVKMQGECE